ncbi:hypothetical protein EDB86DRAFT_2897515 [Lactarius hatsudake]|nr:hypothetical protein EDB86DRAFT_2897515 [Lactarius hatsudake]
MLGLAQRSTALFACMCVTLSTEMFCLRCGRVPIQMDWETRTMTDPAMTGKNCGVCAAFQDIKPDSAFFFLHQLSTPWYVTLRTALFWCPACTYGYGSRMSCIIEPSARGGDTVLIQGARIWNTVTAIMIALYLNGVSCVVYLITF